MTQGLLSHSVKTKRRKLTACDNYRKYTLPRLTILENLTSKHTIMTESLDELNQKYAPKENTSVQFTDSLKMANKGIEDQIR